MATASTPQNRYVRGKLETTKVQAPASTMLNPGDLVCASGGTLQNASNFNWQGSLGASQNAFAAQFVGVMMDQRLSTDATTGVKQLVATEGVFLYPCTSLGSALQVGTFVGPDKDTGSNLLDQQLVSVPSGASNAIGKTVEYAAAGATQLLVHVKGTLPQGAIN